MISQKLMWVDRMRVYPRTWESGKVADLKSIGIPLPLIHITSEHGRKLLPQAPLDFQTLHLRPIYSHDASLKLLATTASLVEVLHSCNSCRPSTEEDGHRVHYQD